MRLSVVRRAEYDKLSTSLTVARTVKSIRRPVIDLNQFNRHTLHTARSEAYVVHSLTGNCIGLFA